MNPSTPAEELAEVERELRAFLDARAELRSDREQRWGEGEIEFSAISEKNREEEMLDAAAAREWRRELFDAGLGWLSGPVELGGRGLGRDAEELFDEVVSEYEIPTQDCFIVGLNIVAPTILVHGTDEVRLRYLKPLYRADIMACQLFSEPDAGSDLAGVRSRAHRVEGGWVVSGQKVWTSGAHYSDIGELLVRTDPDVPKHKGLSMMLVDMHDPGIEVRPLKQMTGGTAFNEVYLTDVFVPDDHVLAEPGEGWRVAMTTLGSERSSMGSGEGADSDPVPRLLRTVEHFDMGDDPALRQRLASVAASSRLLKWTTERFTADPGALGDASMSVLKLLMTRHLMAVSDVIGEVLGPRLVADTGEWGTYVWTRYVEGVPSYRLAGGTDEIMLNIIGERGLGLPREPHP